MNHIVIVNLINGQDLVQWNTQFSILTLTRW